MRPPLVVLALALAASACDDGEPAAELCDGGARQVVTSDEMALSEASAPSLAGEHLVVLAGAPASAHAVDACTGAAEPLAAEDLSGAFALTGEAGALALGHRQPTGEVLLLDRLDVPGLDAPREIARLDPTDSGWFRWPTGLLLWNGPLLRDTPGPAQILWYPGPGGPLQPATPLADDIVWLARGGQDAFLARTSAGALLHVHDATVTPVHPQVRRASLAPDGAHAAWLDRSGSMTLHTLATATSVDLGAHDIVTLRSAGPEPDTWRWTDDALAILDVHGAVIAAHDRATGSRLADPPQHLAARESTPGDLLLLTASISPERVELAWDPHTGASFEWYRGPDLAVTPQQVDAGVRYHVAGQLWLRRPDHAPELLQPEASTDAIALADGRTLMALQDPDDTRRLILLDESGAHATPIAAGVSRWSVTVDDPPRLAYAVSAGDDAGVWITPLASP